MAIENSEIKMMGRPDKEHIRTHKSHPGVNVIVFRLSAEPSFYWKKLFNANYGIGFHSLKRPAHIVDDRIEVEIGTNESKQTVSSFLKDIVAKTNVDDKRNYFERQTQEKQNKQSQKRKKLDGTSDDRKQTS